MILLVERQYARTRLSSVALSKPVLLLICCLKSSVGFQVIHSPKGLKNIPDLFASWLNSLQRTAHSIPHCSWGFTNTHTKGKKIRINSLEKRVMIMNHNVQWEIWARRWEEFRALLTQCFFPVLVEPRVISPAYT